MDPRNRRPLSGPIALLALLSLQSAATYAGGDYAMDYFYAGAPTLRDAEGVVGLHHKYKFACTWDISRHEFDDFESMAKLSSATDRGWVIHGGKVTVHHKGICLGNARWDRSSREVVEEIDLFRGNDLSQAKKNYFGTRVVKGKCFADPFIGGSLCQGMQVKWSIPSWKGGGHIGLALADDLKLANLVACKGFDVSMAKDLSALHKDDPKPPESTPPTQPAGVEKPAGPQEPSRQMVAGSVAPVRSADAGNPPRAVVDGASVLEGPAGASQTRGWLREPGGPLTSDTTQAQGPTSVRTRSMASLLTLEAETIVQSGGASANAGHVVVQPMTGFGSGWSNDSQAFWSGGAVGAVLDLIVAVPTRATYEVEIHLSRAPDYGDLRFEIDGRAAPVTFSGYAPSVTMPTALVVGTFSLDPGSRRVSIMITGRQRQSTNVMVGIDKVVLRPVAAR